MNYRLLIDGKEIGKFNRVNCTGCIEDVLKKLQLTVLLFLRLLQAASSFDHTVQGN